MELSDMHNPTCKLHASQSFEDHSPVRERRTSDVSDIFLSPEAYKATQAVEFIAEHLRNEDEYVQVSENLDKNFQILWHHEAGEKKHQNFRKQTRPLISLSRGSF